MGSDWACLPKHLLDSILEKILSPSGCIRFNAVCMPWYCVAQDNKRKFEEMYSSCHNPPLPLIQTAKKRDWNIYSPMEDKVLGLQLNFPKKRLCGSSKGWLIAMNMDLVVTLINPFLWIKGRKKREDSLIDLPPLARLPEREMSVQINCILVIKATMSTDPILDVDKCIVLVIHEHGKLAFIRLKDKDTSPWTYIDQRRNIQYQDVVHVGDKFYVVEEWGRLSSFDIATQSISNKQLVAGDYMEFDEVVKAYIVVLNDNELWMVQRGFKFNTGRVTTLVRIFKLNSDKCEWVETKTLGDLAFFLGDNFSISVKASNFPGCMPNCIYFNYDYDRINSYPKNRLSDDYCVYNVESRSFSQPYTREAKKLLEKTMQPSFWVVPTLRL
ncbi:F-box protein [Pyrus ussuriensis x Pyrus communis]|uniref:F-box protein n=1 Tax=Pyrus ussuriensis x Pyrus communis TaxID=2448454 RepID=A0A5N5G3H4_9ROSA|nr:F-box protein [Pyrus ussuriensis x Pyrus communis]